jgi:hypothetical protein
MIEENTKNIFDNLVFNSASILNVEPKMLKTAIGVLGSFDFAYALALAVSETGIDMLDAIDILTRGETDLNERMKKIRALWSNPLFVN